jgi:putative protease
MSRQIQPELLAPAGNWECARAAVANGADAIYFGLPQFNARMRADNFSEADLPELMRFLHDHGVRGFAAFNTLIFTSELEAARQQLLTINEAGVDAIIVQDLGLVRLARELTPELEIHASTQMTITSPEALAFVDAHFRLDRAVIARENSLREIRLFHPNEPTTVPLETFVHGALCVAYSGQCLTSESLGQRSANRGECAQACRMPYDLVVDGEVVKLGDRRYLLSPQDLAGVSEIPKLLELGVRSFKIEGRLKTPEYVAAVTRVYRKAIDGASEISSKDFYDLEMVFSRGLSTGWLNGIDNQELVHARYGKKRGAFVGRVEAVGSDWVEVESQAPLANGDGVVFDNGGNTDREQGGRIFSVHGKRISFQRGKLNPDKIRAGDRIWKTDDPKLNAELRKTWKTIEKPRSSVRWKASGSVGEPLLLTDLGSGNEVTSENPLEAANDRPLTSEFLKKQLGRLGNTDFKLDDLEVQLSGEVILPVSEINRLRRALVSKLESISDAPRIRPSRELPLADFLPQKLDSKSEAKLELHVLCRTEQQLLAAIDVGVGRVYLDFEDVRRYRETIEKYRGQAELFLATPRIQKAGETGLFRVVERADPDGILVRNLGGVGYFKERDLPTVGDFSLNVANPISAKFFMEQGFQNLTISYDLNIRQVLDLLAEAPADWFELTLHQHMPMFHMEHCVFCAFMSEGTDVTNCGRPCDEHEVQLRDRVGQLHVLQADVGCRNTLFNGRAQSGARFLSALSGAGLRKYRVELLKESREEAKQTLKTYQQLLSGEIDGESLWSSLQVESKLGVVEGTLA